MNLTGNLPRLVDGDTVYTVKGYSDEMANRLTGSWTALTLGTGWGVVTGYPMQVRKVGSVVYIRGMARFASGSYTQNLTVLPSPFRPTGQAAWLPVVSTASGSTAGVMFPLLVSLDGSVNIPAGYVNASNLPQANSTFSVTGTWITDNIS